MSKVPEAHWQEVGLLVPVPDCDSNAYNTSLCQLNPTELAAFDVKMRRPDTRTKFLLEEFLATSGVVEPSDD